MRISKSLRVVTAVIEVLTPFVMCAEWSSNYFWMFTD